MTESKTTHWSTGFKIQPFGKGRNAIKPNDANDLVDALNILGRIEVFGAKDYGVYYAENGLKLAIKDEDYLEDANDANFNPFRIYSTTDWLTFKVKTGYVITTDNPIVATGIETEFVLTSGVARYWFYMEMTATTAEVKTSATTLTWSSTLIPIGWVDTDTGSASNVSTIHQFLRDHIFNPCLT